MLVFFILLLCNMLFIFFKIIYSKSLQAKIVMINLFTNNSIVLIIAFGLKINTIMLYDVALVYALINFLSSLAFYRFLSSRKNL